MNSANNIVVSPKLNSRIESSFSIEEMKSTIKKNKVEFSEFIADDILEEIFFRLNTLGINLQKEECDHSAALFVDSLESLILSSMGVYHPFQDLANEMYLTGEEIFDFTDDENQGKLDL